MNEEGILVALGYNVNEATLNQLRAILSKSDLNQSEIDRIINLNDSIKIYGGYVAMSNSHNYFKIKIEPEKEDLKDVARDMINSWSEKYKLKLQKVDGKDTYYITGRF